MVLGQRKKSETLSVLSLLTHGGSPTNLRHISQLSPALICSSVRPSFCTKGQTKFGKSLRATKSNGTTYKYQWLVLIVVVL